MLMGTARKPFLGGSDSVIIRGQASVPVVALHRGLKFVKKPKPPY